jgi:DDE superfamily endonuclease
MQRQATQRNAELRAHWKVKLADWDADQLLFIDESAANEFTAHRRYGWSPKGTRAAWSVPLVRSKRWSVLPAYSSTGFLTWDIYQGSYTTELFNAFIEHQILPICTPWPGPRSIIVMDNASIHGSTVVQELYLN